MSQQNNDNERGDNSRLDPPTPAKEQVETSPIIPSEAEFELWLLRVLESERQRLRDKSK